VLNKKISKKNKPKILKKNEPKKNEKTNQKYQKKTPQNKRRGHRGTYGSPSSVSSVFHNPNT